MEDLNYYLKRFKEKGRLKDFSDEYIFSDEDMLENFMIYLKYSLLNKYYYARKGE